MALAVAVMILALAGQACARRPPPPATVPEASISTPPPTLEELRHATYSGFDERVGPVALVNGRWTGAPVQPGAATRPTLELADGFRVVGDLDGDRGDEAVVVLVYRPGGTATLSFLAVVARVNENPRNVATTPLGDRVQIRSVRVEGGRLWVGLVQPGRSDAACCAGDLTESQFVLRDRLLSAVATERTGRLSLDTLSGTVWRLTSWDVPDPAPVEPAVSLVHEAGRLSGSSGCNRYFADVKAGAAAGEMMVGPIGSTRMACSGPADAIEARFLKQLSTARRFGFIAGLLAISFIKADGSPGTMLFEANP